MSEEPSIRIAILPLGHTNSVQVQAVQEGIRRQFRAEVVVLRPREMPKETFYAPRQRYRADRILDYLDRQVRGYDKIVAVTPKDVSATHRGQYDWGVVGLGRLGGYSCVVSSFRLRKKGTLTPVERLRRTATHEVGHTLGLDHCVSPVCVMRDAEGKLKVIDKAGAGLCAACRRRAQPSGVVL